jgi:uncharacterized damage-inducible protein DinB
MSEPALTASDLIAWNEATSANWRQLLTDNQTLLDQACDIAGVTTIAQLVQHIVAVELRFAERLADLPVSDYASLPHDSAATLYATHDRAIAVYRELLASNIDWDASIDYTTRTMGTLRSTRKAILFHALLHSIRHYAQLATLVRQHGVKPQWAMDYLMLHAQRL